MINIINDDYYHNDNHYNDDHNDDHYNDDQITERGTEAAAVTTGVQWLAIFTIIIIFIINGWQYTS